MQIRMLRGGLPRACHLQGPCSDGPHQGTGGHGLATADKSKGCPVLHRVCELLQEVHPELLRNCHPLHVLTQNSKNCLWVTAEQKAFDALKNAFTSTPTLLFPSTSSLFQLHFTPP